MMKHLKYAHCFEVLSDLPDPLQVLKKIVLNFRWTWHDETQSLFKEMDRRLWESVGHNPFLLLNSLSRESLNLLAQNEVFLEKLKLCEEDLDRYMSAKTWFDETYPDAKENMHVGYFCAEFGLSECLPIYSGGLGILGGDHLKAASDLGIPLTGVGLVYSRGYFQQFLNPSGWQQEYYPQYNFYEMPLELIYGSDQQPIYIFVEFPDRVVTCQIWKAQVGRTALYLLDSNVLENAPSDQSITDTLYGGDAEMRLRQEMILGIGGLKALHALGIHPTVCHMNEGHSAFLILERLRLFMEEHKCSYPLARQAVVSGNVFTTHTPVPAGFDLFEPAMIERYFKKTIEQMGMTLEDFLKMGRMDPEKKDTPFNMAVLAMQNSNHVNGVSPLHTKVTQSLFQDHWPNYPEEDVPAESVSNGIHLMSWIHPQMSSLLDRYVGQSWREQPADPKSWTKIDDIPDFELWELREFLRNEFVRFCRKRLQKNVLHPTSKVMTPSELSNILDPRILTIGFAKRFATYKRGNLLFKDKERLNAMLFHHERPVQIVFAGKSHPKDDGGKHIIQDIMNFIHEEGGRARVVFIEDYDIEVARMMVQGVDLWLNLPRRPHEASGTSGMKAATNGVLHCSTLDGWWEEAYQPGLGWVIGNGSEYADTAYQDWLDSLSLYHLLETEIIPKFYNRTDNGIPEEWISIIKKSMKALVPYYSTHRMVQEYFEKIYYPSSETHNRLKVDHLQGAREALNWRKKIRASWDKVKIEKVTDNAKRVNSLGSAMMVEVYLRLGDLVPQDVKVQVVFGKISVNLELKDTTIYDLKSVGCEDGLCIFQGNLKCDQSGHYGYIVKVVPWHENVRVEMELPLVTWEPMNR